MNLTEREREVLALVGQGLSYPRVANVLGISIHTVHSYVYRRIVPKLGAEPGLAPQLAIIVHVRENGASVTRWPITS